MLVCSNKPQGEEDASDPFPGRTMEVRRAHGLLIFKSLLQRFPLPSFAQVRILEEPLPSKVSSKMGSCISQACSINGASTDV